MAIWRSPGNITAVSPARFDRSPLIADPQNIVLYRAQLQYRSGAATVTAGRQPIGLDDERFVGTAVRNVGVQAIYHRFGSDRLVPHYGDQIDLPAQATVGRTTASVRYDDYRADRLAINTRKTVVAARLDVVTPGGPRPSQKSLRSSNPA